MERVHVAVFKVTAKVDTYIEAMNARIPVPGFWDPVPRLASSLLSGKQPVSVSEATCLTDIADDHACFHHLGRILDEEDDFCENWRALYEKCELKPGAEGKAAASSLGPTRCVVKAWKHRAGRSATVGALIELLTIIKRLDAVDAARTGFGLNLKPALDMPPLAPFIDVLRQNRPELKPNSDGTSAKRAKIVISDSKMVISDESMKPFKCPDCDECFSYQTGLRSHRLKMHSETMQVEYPLPKGPTSHTCEVCNKVFGKAIQLEIHARKHTGERPYTCEKCLKTFARPDHLKAHMGTHFKSKLYACAFCDCTFAWSSSLNTHIRSRHNAEATRDGQEGDQKSYYKCHVKGCGKIFPWPSKLKRHLQTHSVVQKEDKSMCSVCHKMFTRPAGLKLHMNRVHNANQDFTCADCGRTFSSHDVWETHIKKAHANKSFAGVPVPHVPVSTSETGTVIDSGIVNTGAFAGANVLSSLSVGAPPPLHMPEAPASADASENPNFVLLYQMGGGTSLAASSMVPSAEMMHYTGQ
eukprot:m.2090 g.2090  ORF g.2090 m.2090 type:complete len:526 (+) comp8276_c0_seq2:37-1614(+)